MDHLPRLSRATKRDRWLRAGRRHAARVFGRVYVALFVVACVLLAERALAYGPAPSTTTQGFVDGTYVSGVYPPTNDPCAVAQSIPGSFSPTGPEVSQWTVPNANTYRWARSIPGTCTRTAAAGGGTFATQSAGTLSYSCPGNATLTGTPAVGKCGPVDIVDCSGDDSTGQCLCPVGQRPGSNGQCENYTCPSGFVGTGDSIEYLSAPGPGSQCRSGCNIVASRQWQGTGGEWYSAGPFVATGAKCEMAQSVEPDAPDEPEVVPLAPGTCPGTVNGQPVVVPCGTTSTTRVETAPDGTRREVVRTCSGGVCIETTVELDVNGTGGTSGGTNTSGGNDSQGGGGGGGEGGGFCEENPGAPICVGSAFGGGCGSFTCDGDAVQCAIAREQHTRNCELFVNATPLSDAGYAAVAAGDRPPGHPADAASGVALDFSSRIDQTDRLGGGAVSDLSLSLVGLPAVSIPLSEVNDELQLLGNLLVGVSMLWALFIVFGRGKT